MIILSVATAAVLPEDAQATIVDYVNNNDGTGNYNFRFETSNGIAREETGSVVNQGQEDQYIEVHGSYSYIDTNGQTVKVKYSVDKDGYHIDDDEVRGILFRTSNGLTREETGSVVNQGQEDQYIEVYGSYSYIDTNDQTVYVRYRADKDGYHIEAKEVPIIGLPPAAVATLLALWYNKLASCSYCVKKIFKMNRIIIACAVLSVAAAAVLPEDAQAQIVNYVNNNDGTGNYNFRFETSNGLKREETGFLINQGQEDEFIRVQGSYSYIDTEGKVVTVIYSADQDGYHIQEKGAIDIDVGLKPVPVNLPTGVVASLLGK
ncbi:hypothetical protein HW555_007251 [Spodoptera exigua]|uniref:Uncharacterized protein n=1 Tax=Spodoptera exigua TaxID=7107 RepID=A0A835GD41_SPOEX|nr:hypothetical protein HW555_007251 [Spodoptera exigua]